MFPLLEWQQILLQLPEGKSGRFTDGCCACGHHYLGPGLDWLPILLEVLKAVMDKKSLWIENELNGLWLKPWKRSRDAKESE